MKPFTTIATPHKDILEGRFTMDTFAADLWEVFKGRAPAEYQDSDLFFNKSYITAGLKNLLEIAEKRLKGEGGDSVIQLQTPFGGGKTHSLIALFHQAEGWSANRVVIDGTALDPKDVTIWEEMESQLTGKIEKLKGRTSPGKEKLRGLFEKHQPLLILMDEVLEYSTKAGKSLAPQVLAFIDELVRTMGTLEKTLLVITLPSSALEHYDENAEKLFHQLQQIIGRKEKIYTPVQEAEISSIIRRRLFGEIDERGEKEIIESFLDYVEKEGILPEGMEKSAYREKFLKSYPFQPEIIEVLYKRWGSFPTFQRTRGVLRLLSLVVYSLRKSQIPFVKLSDFDLANDEIKRELIKHIGQEYDSVIAQDITSENSGAKKIDGALGSAYIPFSFGTRVATSIFLYSFSGGPEKGAIGNEIKLSSADPSCPSSVIAEALSKLRENLFFLQSDGKFFFTNQPNLNKILLTKMEGVSKEILTGKEKELLVENLKKEKFEIFIWPSNSRDIPDTKRLKLVLLKSEDQEKCKDFWENYGKSPRVYRNTLAFLLPRDSEKTQFEEFLKKKQAWRLIEQDKSLNLTSAQKKEIQGEIKEMATEGRERLRSLYRLLLLPSRSGFKEIDLGIPTYGAKTTIDEEVYERLKTEEEVLEAFSPLLVKKKYLKEKDYVETKNILESFFKTPGEIRITSEEVLKDSIREGVRKGLFGIGDLENNSPVCRHFEEETAPELVEGEILVKADLCKPKEGILPEKLQEFKKSVSNVKTKKLLQEISDQVPWKKLSPVQKEVLKSEIEKREKELEEIARKGQYTHIFLKLRVPSGRLSDVMRMLQYLKEKFEKVSLETEISASEGRISPSEYEDKIKEAIKQADIEVEEERFK